MQKIICILLFIFSLQAYSQVVRNFEQAERPIFEFGAGAIGAVLPNYPGAKSTTFRFLPFPYFVYRGKFLRADDEGTRAKLEASENYELGLSFGFKFPVDSEDNDIREAMPDLDAVFGLGPQLIFRVIKDDMQKLNISFSLRTTLSVGDHFKSKGRGLILDQSINYWRYLNSSKRTVLIVGLGAEMGSTEYNDYYYTVSDEFQTAKRDSYKAKPGLIELGVFAGIMHNISSKLTVFGALSYKDFSLAENRDSPLLESDQNLGAIFGFSWLFFESEEKVNIYR